MRISRQHFAVGNYRRLLIVLALVLVLGVLALLIRRVPAEPVYQGKPLSYWLQGYVYGRNAPVESLPNSKQADEAMAAIGTNAVPTLLRWLRATDSPLRIKLEEIAIRARLIRTTRIFAAGRHLAAADGFEALCRAHANEPTNAIPALIQIYRENISSSSRAGARALASFGPLAAEAIPEFLPQLTVSRGQEFSDALKALRAIRARPDLCVPALTKLLGDPGPPVRREAAWTLAAFGADAKPAVPALVQALNDVDVNVREYAQVALRAIDPATAARLQTNTVNQ